MKSLHKFWLGALLAGALVAATPRGASAAGETIAFSGDYHAGSIVIVTHSRELYYVLGNGRAIRYPVGVGKAGMAWEGHARVAQKFIRPGWSPPDDIWRANPSIPGVIPGGDPRNPMGAAALGLDHGNYAIHGTNNPSSVGHFVSHGCIRMHNADIMDLYNRVPRGTDVYVLR
jgi:lipoprotein-anchoring transpeptidase ErfK/SrfK